MPPYVTASQLREDGDEGDLVRAEASSGFLFRNCLTITGMLRIFSNASKDLYKVFAFWVQLHDCLKTLEPLVKNKERMKKYVHTCLEGTPHEHMRDMFTKRLAPHLYDKRWGEVFKFCVWLLPRIAILRETWSANKFKARGLNRKPLLLKPILALSSRCCIDSTIVSRRESREVVSAKKHAARGMS